LRDHAGGLVEAREARVRKDVVRGELAELLAGLDRLHVLPHLAVRHGEAVPGVDEARVERDGLLIARHRLLQLAVAEEIDGGGVGPPCARAPRYPSPVRPGAAKHVAPPGRAFPPRRGVGGPRLGGEPPAAFGAPAPPFSTPGALRFSPPQSKHTPPYRAFCI